jgi:hypothetical protein
MHYFTKFLPSQYTKRCRQLLAIGGMLCLSFITSCEKKEEPAAPPEEKPQSLMEQYKEASKATAEDPGLAASPGQMKEEEEKSGE